MNTPPLVSIALCTYNGEKFLETQLNTLINQTYKNIEIIVVDDRSTDSTFSILTNYEKGGKIKLYQNEHNLGFAKNFEKAISLCKGDLIALSDQDDIWDLRKIELQVSNIGDNLLIYHDSDFIDSQGNPMGSKLSDYFRFVKGGQNMSFVFHNCVSGHTMLFKRELLKYVFPIPPKFFHDWWMTYAAATVGNITYLEKSLVQYRQHANSFTDILRMKESSFGGSSKIATADDRRKNTELIIHHLSHFRDFAFNKEEDKTRLKQLISLYQKREHSYSFCLGLCLTLLMGRREYFYIDKTYSNNPSRIIKNSIGHQLKNSFHKYKKKYLGQSN